MLLLLEHLPLTYNYFKKIINNKFIINRDEHNEVME